MIIKALGKIARGGRVRAAILAAILAATATAVEPLGFVDDLNSFASSYNVYVVQLQRGVVDLKALKRMRAEWHRLEKSAGWPEEKACSN